MLLLFGIAAVTSVRCVGTWTNLPWTAIAASAAAVLALMLGAGVAPAKPIATIPIAGIVIGGAITAASQAVRRALDELKSRHGEYEAAPRPRRPAPAGRARGREAQPSHELSHQHG